MSKIIPKTDWQWVRDVHKVDIPGEAKVVVLHGNEDAPEKIEVFFRDHYQAIPATWKPDAEGLMQRQIPEYPIGFALDEADFFGLREVCDKLLNTTHRMTFDEIRDLGNKMHVHLHKAIHI